MKKLKILLGNNTLSLLAGSETWTYTLAVQLKKMGHDVQGFSPDLGIIARELKNKNIPSHADIAPSGIKPFSFVLEEKQELDFDLIIANHWHIVDYCRRYFPKTPIISTVHGIIHTMPNPAGGEDLWAPEHPALNSGVNAFVAVSEEIQEILQKDYNLESTIIRNFFDTELYNVPRPVADKPKVFLINTNYNTANDPEIELIRAVTKHYGAQMIATGVNFGTSLNMVPAIDEADVVVGMGRSVLEGVCAGRLGIVNGRWGFGGVIHEGSVEELRGRNFSGRNSGGKTISPEELIALIDEHYNPTNLEWGRNYIKREHNVELAAESFLRLGESFMGQGEVGAEPIKMLKYRKARDVQQPAPEVAGNPRTN